MNRFLTILAVSVIGCATTGPPNVAIPERCVCPATTPCDEVASVQAQPWKPAPWTPSYQPPPSATPPLLEEALNHTDLAPAVRADTPAACNAIAKEADAALAEYEPDVIVEIRDARALRTGTVGATTTEREFLAWQAFDEIVARAAAKLVGKIAAPMERALLGSPHIEKAAATAVADSVTPLFGSEHADVFIDIALERMPALHRAAFDAAAKTCAETTVARAHGRWVAIFKGKL